MDVERTGSIAYRPTEVGISLAAELRRLDARSAARRVAAMAPADAGTALELLNPATARQILWELDDAQRAAVLAAAPQGMSERWTQVQDFPEGTVGRLMENPRAVFRPETSVGEAIDRLRDLVQKTLITYGFVTDDEGRLKTVFAFRDLLYAERSQKLGEVGVLDPFSLRPDTKLVDAMQEVVTRHYPAYPVCDAQGRLLGMVRGHALFEAEAFEISAQAGKMQGISKEERISTPWPRSLVSRHPWLQLNLVTAFIAGGVVGVFQNTIDQIVVLAAFLPILAGQSGNTGCQALAVTLRGMTLGEVKPGFMFRMVAKETLLGFFNGLLVGIIAGGGMYWYASSQADMKYSPLMLGGIVCAAMILACVASGISGTLIPLALKKAGADPATASSIFLTTMTDVASMGAFLGLATWLLL